ncbi:MAG: BspA family leucine-rich repeat surface protein [Oscillospiraceae bacterium]|nr:BspA family leucine-rich repeat surface protein [Oscillospiraceae bacterium]
MKMSIKQRLVSGLTALSILSSALFPATVVFSEEMDGSVTSEADTTETSLTDTAEATSADDAADDTEQSGDANIQTDEHVFTSADGNITLTVKGGSYVLGSGEEISADDTELTVAEISSDAPGMSASIAHNDADILHGYALSFESGGEEVEVTSDDVQVSYVFTEEDAVLAEAMAIYVSADDTWTQIYTDPPATRDGYCWSVSFSAVLPDMEGFCALLPVEGIVSDASAPDEAILSADRQFDASCGALSVTATAPAGTVCTGVSADGEKQPENINNVRFTVEELSSEDERYSAFPAHEGTELTVYAARFSSESCAEVLLSDCELTAVYSLAQPIGTDEADTLKVMALNADGEAADTDLTTVTDGDDITGLSFTTKSMVFGVYSPLAVDSMALRDGDGTNYAHTVNLFDIDLKTGAEYYQTYIPTDPKDPSTSLSDAYVWKADQSNEGHKFVFNIKVSISGEGNSDTVELTDQRFIQIRIPAHILKFKDTTDTSAPDTLEMPVPDASLVEGSSLHTFVYEYDAVHDEYVIYNIGEVSAGVVYEFPVAYVMNKNTWEYEDLKESNPCHAHLELASWEKEGDPKEKLPLSADTNNIPVYIDTSAKITKTSKRAEPEAVLIDAAAAMKKTGLSDLDDSYYYTIWSVASDISGVTQKYDLGMTDTPDRLDLTGTDGEGTTHTVPGEIYAVNMGQGYKTADTEGAFRREGLTASGRRTDYVLSRYPKESVGGAEGVDALEDAPKKGLYTSTNDVTMTLTPADGMDAKTEKSGSATFKKEVRDPEWHQIETRYSADKYGLYGNDKRVTNRSNISSFSLSNLTDDADQKGDVPGLRYQTVSTAHAYGKTIADLNAEITSISKMTTDSEDHTVIETNTDSDAPNRRYTFYPPEGDQPGYVIITVNDVPQDPVPLDPYPTTELAMDKIVAQDIADNYYGQKSLTYTLTDKQLKLSAAAQGAEPIELGNGDYHIDNVYYKLTVKRYEYDPDEMTFTVKDVDPTDEDHGYLGGDNDIISFYAYINGSDEPQLVGTYDMGAYQANIVDDSVVRYLTSEEIIFYPDANVTGYEIRTTNKYFYVELETKPEVTLHPTEAVIGIADPVRADGYAGEKKLALANTSVWNVTHEDGDVLMTAERTGTDYIAEIVRESDITKKALGERVTIRGQDGNIYKSRNDTLMNQYELAWQVKANETANGVEVNGTISNDVPVRQESGIFYDLLPAHCDIIEGSVNVYKDLDGDAKADSKPLPPSSFEVLDRIDNYNGSGKKLLIIKINEPCEKSYTVTYVTVHSHDDIQDYGSFALNTVAYQTGNADIGEGYPDNGGNYAVSMSSYITGLDPDNNGAKRFIYAESTEDILALFPTSSGIYKKVASANDPTYKKSGSVHNGSRYTYNIRMQNSPSTKARDIAILDSVENFRTVNGTQYNSGLSTNRDWAGKIVSFDLTGIKGRMVRQGLDPSQHLKLVVYRGDQIIDLDNEHFSDSKNRKYLLQKLLGTLNESTLTPEERAELEQAAAGWSVIYDVDDPGDLSNVTAFIVYTGPDFELAKGDSMSFSVTMEAPATVEVDDPAEGEYLKKPLTYNNVYRSFTNVNEDAQTTTYFYTHYDYTQVEYITVGTVKFSKTDSYSGEGIPGVEFSLSGISDYGTPYNETLVSDSNGVVQFKGLERGTYQLVETASDDDHLLDTTPLTVKVDPQGQFTMVKYGDADLVQVDEHGNVVEYLTNDVITHEGDTYSFKNAPRYHGDLEFTKVDALDTSKGVKGATFVLNGISDYYTAYDNITAVSDSNGVVRFENIEMGSYTITETIPADGYLPPTVNTYSVTSTGSDMLVFRISGEGAERGGMGYIIKNTPTAQMHVQKTDSITKKMLDGAVFTLTADSSPDSSLDSTLTTLTDTISDTGWVKDGGVWTQNGIPTSVAGVYDFGYMPEGHYKLTETTPPEGYAAAEDPYGITVKKSSDGKRLIVAFDEGTEGVEYIKLENGDFTETSAEDAQYHRIYNEQTFDDGKTIVKSWFGGTGEDGKFPVMHLSNDKPEETITKVTIGTKLKDLISTNKGTMTGFVREKSLPSGVTIDTIDPAFKDSSFTDETGHFYAWMDGGVLKWWSDASVVYMPTDSSFLFMGLNTKNIEEIDLSAFDFSKVTTMKGMFASTTAIDGKGTERTKIRKITFPSDIDTSNVINMEGVFWGCNQLTTLDLTGFDTDKVTSMNFMFKNCNYLKEIKLDPTKFTDDSLKSVWRMFDSCYSLKQIDLRGFKGDKLEDARSWFARCYVLEYIDLSNFNGGSKITKFDYSLQYIQYNDATYREYSENSIRKGCAIFSNKWNLNNPSYKEIFDGPSQFNLYGQKYTPASYAVANFDIATAAEGGGTTSVINGKVNRYFNDPNGAYYTEFFDEEYRNKYTTETQSTNTNSNNTTLSKTNASTGKMVYLSRTAVVEPTFSPSFGLDLFKESSIYLANSHDAPTYPNFTYVSSSEPEAVTDPDAKPGKVFSFEYKTAATASTSISATEYQVKESIIMTVIETYSDSGTLYKVSHKYDYSGDPIYAKWTSVERAASEAPGFTEEWYCEMKVFNADDQFFAWEDRVGDYESTALWNSPITTVGSEDRPVITNSKDIELGDLKVVKQLGGITDGTEKYSRDTFHFKVTMTNNGDPYTSSPFDSNGVYAFDISPGEENAVYIKGIPAGSEYMVEEIGTYEGYTSGTSVTGTIVKDTDPTATITNTIDTRNITLTKTSVLLKKTSEGGSFTPVTAPDDDLAAWQAREFTFDVMFDNLVMGETYTYTITHADSTTSAETFTGNSEYRETDVTLTIKGGDTVVFKDLPTCTTYRITEAASDDLANSEDGMVTYERAYQVNGGELKDTNAATALSTEDIMLTANDTVAFTNTKKIDLTVVPETVSVTVNKKWYAENGTEVVWQTHVDDNGELVYDKDDNGNFITTPSGNYPSFLKIYLGRALKVTDGGKTIYLNNESAFTSYSLKAKEAWSYTFEDLEKYGTITWNGIEQRFPYVYYISEIVPTGFFNSNEAEEKSKLSIFEGTSGLYFDATAADPINRPDELGFTLKNHEDETCTLAIYKKITGGLGDREQSFTFNIDLYDASGKPYIATGFIFKVTDMDTGAILRNRTYTADSGTLTVDLRDGMMVEYIGLPKDIRYTITEQGNDYKTTSGIFDGDTEHIDIDALTLDDTTVQSGTLTDDISYIYVNDMSLIVPSGAHLPKVTTVFIGFLALGIIALTRRERLRISDEDDE